MTAGPYRIFLSHSAHDRGLVEGVVSQLQAVGVEVYLYEEHSQPGRSIPEKLQEAIRNCDALVALLTPASGHRPFVHEEIGFALGVGKQAVALLTTDVTGQEGARHAAGRVHTSRPERSMGRDEQAPHVLAWSAGCAAATGRCRRSGFPARARASHCPDRRSAADRLRTLEVKQQRRLRAPGAGRTTGARCAISVHNLLDLTRGWC